MATRTERERAIRTLENRIRRYERQGFVFQPTQDIILSLRTTRNIANANEYALLRFARGFKLPDSTNGRGEVTQRGDIVPIETWREWERARLAYNRVARRYGVTPITLSHIRTSRLSGFEAFIEGLREGSSVSFWNARLQTMLDNYYSILNSMYDQEAARAIKAKIESMPIQWFVDKIRNAEDSNNVILQEIFDSNQRTFERNLNVILEYWEVEYRVVE